jgi:gamma-glutamyltranspeptidase/glutathione hydrolase
MNNRMCGFSLEHNSPNVLEPKKMTAHTLNSYIVLKDGIPNIVGGTPGGDDQVQVNLQVLVNILDYKMNVQEAIEAPRWSSKPGTIPGEELGPYELWIENRIATETFRNLIRKGHMLKVLDGWVFGSAQVITIDSKNDVIMGGADPRRDGYAVGY